MRSGILVAGLVAAVVVGACADGDGVASTTSSAMAATDGSGATPSSGGATSTAGQSAATMDPSIPSPGGSPGLLSVTEPAVVSLVVEAYEWKYEPDSWTVASGEDITIEFSNRGGTEHDWNILALGEQIAKLSEFEDDMVLFQIDAVPRQESVTETFRIDDPGTYQVICSLSGHFNTGMGGTLVVR